MSRQVAKSLSSSGSDPSGSAAVLRTSIFVDWLFDDFDFWANKGTLLGTAHYNPSEISRIVFWTRVRKSSKKQNDNGKKQWKKEGDQKDPQKTNTCVFSHDFLYVFVFVLYLLSVWFLQFLILFDKFVKNKLTKKVNCLTDFHFFGLYRFLTGV